MKKHMHLKRKQVYIRWFFSYILLLLPPIMIGCILYFHTLQANRQQAQRLNESLMTIVTNEFDNQLDKVIKSLNRLALDSNVQGLSNTKGAFSAKEQYNLFELYNNLTGTSFSEGYTEEVFVYFKNTDWVVSTHGNMSFDLFYSLYGKNEQYTAEEMRTYLSGFHFQDVLPLTYGEKSSLLFTMNCLQSEVGDTSAVIGVRMDMGTLDELFATAKWDDRIQLGILDAEERVINATNEELIDENFPTEIVVDGENYVSMEVPARFLDWKYILFVPQSLYEENARQIQRFCLLGLCASIVIGLILSYYLCKVNYNPLKDLMGRFMSQGKVSAVEENEFQWLSQQSEKIFSEYNSARQVISDNARQLKWYALLKLLENPYDPEGMEGDFAKFRISPDAAYNVALIFTVDSKESGAEDTGDNVQENALHKFILTNVFEEKAMEYYQVEILDLGRQVAAIVNIPLLEGTAVRMKEILEDTLQFVEDTFHFKIMVFMGGVNGGAEGIHESYLQAKEAQEYAELLDTDMVIYDEVKNIQKKYAYSIDTEQKIINAIKAGNSEIAYETVRQVLERNYGEPISVDMRRCLIYDMMGTLLKGAEEGGYYTFAEDFHFGREITNVSEEAVRARFDVLVRGVCEKIGSIQKDTDEDRKMSRKIEAYIQENYGDPDLNISILGQQFHMTPAYLSGIYKKQTGNGLLDYINQVRIEHAEELLRQGASVVEVAQKVGYRDSGAFIRVFKKKKGMTPGQLKKQAEK